MMYISKASKHFSVTMETIQGLPEERKHFCNNKEVVRRMEATVRKDLLPTHDSKINSLMVYNAS